MRTIAIIGTFALVLTSAAYAVTPPTLTISDGTNSATIDSTGAVSTSGTASVVLVSIHTATEISASVITVGGFSVSTVTCIVNTPNPLHMDCNIGLVSAASAGTLTVTWTDSGLSVSGTLSGGTLDAGGSLTGTGSVTFSTVVNGGTVATLGPFTTSSFSGSTVGAAAGTTPVTESEVVTFNFAAGTSGGGDFAFQPVVTPPTGGGCPATKGFWKNEKKHPFPGNLGFPLTIGGVAYSSADLYTILGAPAQGNAVLIMGSQLVAALLNIAAGATHSSSVDTAIAGAESLLQVGLPGGPVGVTFPINMTTEFVDANTALGTAMTNAGTYLDGYNSANFETCSEGSGLQLGQ